MRRGSPGPQAGSRDAPHADARGLHLREARCRRRARRRTGAGGRRRPRSDAPPTFGSGYDFSRRLSGQLDRASSVRSVRRRRGAQTKTRIGSIGRKGDGSRIDGRALQPPDQAGRARSSGARRRRISRRGCGLEIQAMRRRPRLPGSIERGVFSHGDRKPCAALHHRRASSRRRVGRVLRHLDRRDAVRAACAGGFCACGPRRRLCTENRPDGPGATRRPPAGRGRS